jgi:tRNA(fMet)-specific endonuclease VapC
VRRYLLDTGIAQDFINRCHGILERVDPERHAGSRIGICTPVLGELWSGIEGSVSRDRNLQRLRHALSRLMVWPYTNEAAEQLWRIFAELRRMGRAMQQTYIMIAAISMSLRNCTIVTTDSDLSSVPRVTVENWVRTEGQ